MLFSTYSNMVVRVKWCEGQHMLADDGTKSQESTKSLPHMKRTLVPIPEQVNSKRTDAVIGNR